jgi:tripartite-type tricarboxylate transporter receptor subunit TctC
MSSRVRLVVGFSAGSASDQIARLITPALSRELGKEISIELEPGNNGAEAACEVAAAKADGSTLFMATLGTHALAPHLNAALPYDPLHHFAAVSLVTTSPLVLGCHSCVGARNIAELTALARARPGALTYAAA